VYGLSPELDAALGTSCSICGHSQRFQALATDHDHRTGEVRGKLCYRCNHLILGGGHDSLQLLRNAVAYLEDPPAQRILRDQQRKP
jgi:hypothetical protein